MSTPNKAISIDDVSREQSMPRPWPAFSAPLELLYRLEDGSNNHKIAAVSWLIGLYLANLFLISDFFVAQNDIGIYIVGRICLQRQ